MRGRNAHKREVESSTSSVDGREDVYSTMSALGISVPSSARRMRRHEPDYSLEVDLADTGPLQQQQQQQQARQHEQYRQYQLSQQHPRQRPPQPHPQSHPQSQPGAVGSASYNDVFVRPRIFTSEWGDDDYEDASTGGGGMGERTGERDRDPRCYDEEDALDEEEIILM